MDNVDECSSYGTGYSRKEEMETTTIEVPDDMGKAMKSLQASIEAINAVQAVIIEKLASLEKVILTVQLDMTWVRDDMSGVHNVMEKLANNVGVLRDATVEVERFREQVSVDAAAQWTLKRKRHLEGSPKSPNAGNERGEHDGCDDCEHSHDPTCYEPGSYIEETQRLDTNVEMHINIVSSLEEERGDNWGYAREASYALCCPPCKQTRGNIGEDALLKESQRMEMSSPSTHLRTPASCRSMWTQQR